MQMDHVKTYPVENEAVLVGLPPAGEFDRPRGYPVVSHRIAVQRRYEEMRRNGESHNMAEILALRTFPATRTDVEFNRGRCNGNQFEATPGLGDRYKQEADRAGVSVTGKHYCSGLAEYPGDPAAWITGKGDVLRVAREKGMKVSGMVEYDPGERQAPDDIEIADDIVDSATDDIMDADGGSRRADVREAIRARLTGHGPEGALRVKDPTEDWG